MSEHITKITMWLLHPYQPLPHPPILAPIPDQLLEPELPNSPGGSASPPPTHRQSHSPINNFTEPLGAQKKVHPHLTAVPCDEDGTPLAPGTPPPPRTNSADNDWSPYIDKVQFRLADFTFRLTDFTFHQAELSGRDCNELLEIWALDKMQHDGLAAFTSSEHMYAVIDSTKHGDMPWKSFKISWAGELTADSPTWKREEYEICGHIEICVPLAVTCGPPVRR
ncbi:uncharacterized protein LACBIDRAFT_308938 [Laccaria bicolor S238N-H82]|uniref:Predicted protein n=1 Tax=Laccaria bicolor (strain S238N-H82 / ATCC MYA-4686) TaxID=486041 RepID=B0CV49_LACBS|nr:uncharacterized protein LACBIDRAFT_308938 [Laccaria bicolor S238N-H82]EDR13266.1 predicted protein [Laccaria bicolor S238N-H82]|eukprot:XP_001875764.1 predicted protein [Laccaria bicolor S238N-H82]